MACIGKIGVSSKQRLKERRTKPPETTITTHSAFASEERKVFKTLERRRALRRKADVQRAIAQAS